jgi:hypothetical protein
MGRDGVEIVALVWGTAGVYRMPDEGSAEAESAST